MKTTTVITLILAFLFSATSLRANTDRSEAQTALDMLLGKTICKDSAAAIAQLTEEAVQGNAFAIHALGLLNLKGIGVYRDVDKAICYLTEAAELGYYNGWMNLAKIYETGDGVAKDYVKANDYYLTAIQAGCYSALYPAGCLAYYGLGRPVDYKQAHDYFLRSANMRQAESMFMLGLCYEYGQGVTADDSEARSWFEMARLNGIRAAIPELKKDLEHLAVMSDTLNLLSAKVYPMVFDRECRVDFELKTMADVRITVVSLSSQKTVYTYSCIYPEGTNCRTIELDRSTGIYVITLQTETEIRSFTALKR